MIKSSLFRTWLVLLFLPLVHSAQGIDSTQYMYADLPDVLFPNGFLHDQSLLRDLNTGTDYDLRLFNGAVPGKLNTKRHGELAYNDLYLSQRLKNGLLFGTQPPMLKKWPEFQRQSTAEDTLGVDVSLYLNWFKVHELDTNALENGWLYFKNDQFSLMPNKLRLGSSQNVIWNTPSPMDSALKAVNEFNVFFGGTNSSAHYVDNQQVTLTFSLLDYLVQSNQALPTVFYLDLDDGQGFRQVTLDQKVKAQYSTTASVSELVYKNLAIRVQSNGQWLETRFRIPLIFNVSEPDLVLHTDSMPSPVCFSADAPNKDASITVKYANKGLGIQKPIVIVEGFESSLKPYGLISYAGLSSGVILDENDEQVYHGMAKLAWLYDSLYSAGYDIVHVDFKQSKQSIKDNMASLIRALYWVNSQNASEPAIVVGASMGGLIARAALLELERNDCCQNISAYGTFDTPHDGAFVPLGVQMGAKRMGELSTILWTWPLVKTWSKALNSPTAREMLIDHLDPSARQERADLVSFYNNEQPKTVRRFAISNGSDLNVSAPLADSDDIIARWGSVKEVTYKHRVNPHIDSLLYNKSGGDKRQIIGYGASIEGMGSASNFLYYGHNLLTNTLNFRKIKFYSKFNARNALLVNKLSKWNLIKPLDAAAAIEHIQKESNDRLDKIHKAIVSNASTLDKKSFYHNYSEVSGSSTNSAKGFNRIWYAEILSPSHTFIPAFSALNVGKDFANTSFRGRMDIIPFHSYISPGLIDDQAGANQEHIFTDEAIINFAMNSFAGVHQIIGSNGVLSSDYNIAKEHNTFGAYPSHIETLEVAKGVTLSVGNQGFVGSSNVPVDGSQNIEVFVGNGCTQGELRIKGTLKIGDVPGHFAKVRLNKGSTLILEKGSSLLIGPGSELIVESGATLVIEPNVNIEWNDGKITVEGTLNADSGVDVAPVGSGTLTFSKSGKFSPQSFGAIHLEHSRLNVKNVLHLPVSIAEVTLNECTVTFYSKGELKVRSDFELLNSKVEYQSNKQWAGLHFSNNALRVEHTEFTGGSPALTVASNSSFILENSTFTNAILGLKCFATPSRFYANKFFNCTTGAQLKSGTMVIERNLFHGCDRGLVFTASAQNTPLQLLRNVFTSNLVEGSSITDANVRMECNEWSYNAVGHEQLNGFLSLGSMAGNVFNSNITGIKFQDIRSLALNYGQNKFQNSANLDIQGAFDPKASVPHNGAHYFVSTDYNSFTNSWSTDMTLGRAKVYPMKSPNTQPSSYVCPAKGPGKAQDQGIQNSPEMSLVVFPNPSTSPQVQITFSPIQQEGTLEIFDSQGALIVAKKISAGANTKTISVSNTPGTFIIRLIAGERIETARWVLL